MEKKFKEEGEQNKMRKAKALLLLSIILIPSYILMMSPPAKAPPFYGISYQVVTDWNTYKTVIESYQP
jgi:hypothetical protein